MSYSRNSWKDFSFQTHFLPSLFIIPGFQPPSSRKRNTTPFFAAALVQHIFKLAKPLVVLANPSAQMIFKHNERSQPAVISYIWAQLVYIWRRVREGHWQDALIIGIPAFFPVAFVYERSKRCKVSPDRCVRWRIVHKLGRSQFERRWRIFWAVRQ